MFNNPYMIPRYMPNMYGSMPVSMARGMTRGIGGSGLFSKLGGSFSAIKSFNWGGLINNASKTLGVINQTIPLVKQAGPMVRNMKSVLRIASAFKDETDPPKRNNNTSINEKKNTSSSKEYSSKKNVDNSSHSNSPVFFVS